MQYKALGWGHIHVLQHWNGMLGTIRLVLLVGFFDDCKTWTLAVSIPWKYLMVLWWQANTVFYSANGEGGVYNAVSLDEKTLPSGLVFCEHYTPIWWKLIIARQESIISKRQTEFSWFWAQQSFQIWRVIAQNSNTALSEIKIYTQTKIVFEQAKITDNHTVRVRVDLVVTSFLIANSFEQRDFPCNKYPTAFNLASYLKYI